MDAVSGVSADMVARSVDALCSVMQAAVTANIEIAEKMIAMQAEIVLARESGKGELLDIRA